MRDGSVGKRRSRKSETDTARRHLIRTICGRLVIMRRRQIIIVSVVVIFCGMLAQASGSRSAFRKRMGSTNRRRNFIARIGSFEIVVSEDLLTTELRGFFVQRTFQVSLTSKETAQ